MRRRNFLRFVKNEISEWNGKPELKNDPETDFLEIRNEICFLKFFSRISENNVSNLVHQQLDLVADLGCGCWEFQFLVSYWKRFLVSIWFL